MYLLKYILITNGSFSGVRSILSIDRYTEDTHTVLGVYST